MTTPLPSGDYVFGVARPNWAQNTGIQSVSSNFEFIVISTAVPIQTFTQNLTAAGVTAATASAAQLAAATASQDNLNKLLEIVSLRGQPIILGSVTGTGPYVLTLVNEHVGAWGNATAALPAGSDLKSRIIADGVNFGFGVSTVGDSGTPTVPYAYGAWEGAGVLAGVDDTGLSVTITTKLT